MKRMVGMLLVILLGWTVCADEWKPAENPIYSPWAEQVNPAAPLPDYPRPQLERSAWQSLNGLWDYAILPAEQASVENYDGKILVPFAIESALSGVKKTVGKDSRLHYARTFQVPSQWSGSRILLNFEAVDWQATVYVNDQEVGKHTGGYAPFSLDITDALKNGGAGEQSLKVVVFDPTDDGFQPIGKQINNPQGIWYTSVTGIWQSVWIEPVNATGKLISLNTYAGTIKDGKFVPTTDGTMTLEGKADAPDGTVCKILVKPRNVVSKRMGNRAKVPLLVSVEAKVQDGQFSTTFRVPNPKLWTPDSPTLYNMTLQLVKDGKVFDTANSYFGIRTSTLGKKDDGKLRMLLNDKFLFQYGPLDQGWWPDGLYTAPTDEALKFDIVMTKKMGFNMLRKHVKVESRRFYYWCDLLGMLVWQDMPSGDTKHYIGPKDPDAERSPEAVANYYHEWGEIIANLSNSPSIVMWVPFNEGWGQFDTCGVVDWTKKADPTRLVDCASGWSDRPCGDVVDMHCYPGPNRPEVNDTRAIVLGEFGGLGLPCKGNAWKESGNWGYVSFDDKEGLFQRYSMLIRRLRPLIDEGLSAAVYTQTTDVEIEVNGLFSYDRKVDKMGVDRVAMVNRRLYLPAPKVRTILPSSQKEGQEWSYTSDKPADGWTAEKFDASAWKVGKGGFGTEGTPEAIIGTVWDTSEIWLRKEFNVDKLVAGEILNLIVSHDEDVEIYLNGVKIFEEKGYKQYQHFELPASAYKALKAGKNILAVHVSQTTGGQYVDVGLEAISE